MAVHAFCTGAFTGHVFDLIVGYCSHLAAGVFSLPPSTAVQYRWWRGHGGCVYAVLPLLPSMELAWDEATCASPLSYFPAAAI